MKVKINKDGLLSSPEVLDANIEIEVDDSLQDKLSTIPYFKDWQYKDGEWSLVSLDSYLKNDDNYLRRRRQKACFKFLDGKSQMWYRMLSEDQTKELKQWYQAWLDVTDTHIIPTTPSWIK